MVNYEVISGVNTNKLSNDRIQPKSQLAPAVRHPRSAGLFLSVTWKHIERLEAYISSNETRLNDARFFLVV
jgi:hypothetical protein